MLPQLNDYNDLILKLDYDLKRFTETEHIYDLLNCLLTLNLLPEWIISETSSESIKTTAEQKIRIMKGLDGFVFNENLLHNDINQKLRFVRLICNHIKHKTNSKNIPIIKSLPSTSFPMMLPARFCISISIGNLRVDGGFLVYQILEFWKNELSK